EQGEGVPDGRQDSHFGTFRRIRAAVEASLRSSPGFEPARPVLENPVPRIRPDWASRGHVSLIVDPYSRDVADLFDDVYNLMLRLLQHGFSTGPAGPLASTFVNGAIE